MVDNRENKFISLICLLLFVMTILVFSGNYNCKFEMLISYASDQRYDAMCIFAMLVHGYRCL